MTENNSPKNEHDGENREEKINALLDGELNADESESLKRAATTDQDLAADIVEAYQLQRAMEDIQVEKAPASLRRKLKLIPRQNRPVLLQPRWVMAFSVVPLMVISVALMRSPEQLENPAQGITPQAGTPLAGIDQASIEQARIEQAFSKIKMSITIKMPMIKSRSFFDFHFDRLLHGERFVFQRRL